MQLCLVGHFSWTTAVADGWSVGRSVGVSTEDAWVLNVSEIGAIAAFAFELCSQFHSGSSPEEFKCNS